ncbi:MAG TPA: aldo/keto reductase [Chloroflexota bacterium]
MCLGTMMFGTRCSEAESDRVLSDALDHGVNFVDTAAMYANGETEAILGRIMRGRRAGLFLATKVHRGLDAASIESSIDDSLSRLQTDYVDLYLVHWPATGMRPVEVMEALSRVVKAGKARYVGGANFPAWLLAHSNAIAAEHGWPKLVNNQVAYNLFERGVEVEILPQAVAEKIAVTAYRPSAEGLLTGKYAPGSPLPADSRGESSSLVLTWLSQYGESVERFNLYAASLGVHPASLALAWVRFSDGVTSPIVGVSKISHLEAAYAGFACDLTPQQYAEVTALFGTEVKEEGLQRFPGRKYNFPRLRRNLHLLG